MYFSSMALRMRLRRVVAVAWYFMNSFCSKVNRRDESICALVVIAVMAWSPGLVGITKGTLLETSLYSSGEKTRARWLRWV